MDPILEDNVETPDIADSVISVTNAPLYRKRDQPLLNPDGTENLDLLTDYEAERYAIEHAEGVDPMIQRSIFQDIGNADVLVAISKPEGVSAFVRYSFKVEDGNELKIADLKNCCADSRPHDFFEMGNDIIICKKLYYHWLGLIQEAGFNMKNYIAVSFTIEARATARPTDGGKFLPYTKRTSDPFLMYGELDHTVPLYYFEKFTAKMFEDAGETEYSEFFYDVHSMHSITSLTINVWSMMKNIEEYGGCNSSFGRKILPPYFTKNLLYCPSGTDNMCFWQCMAYLKYYNSGSTSDDEILKDAVKIRDNFKYTSGMVVSLEDAYHFVNELNYNVNFILMKKSNNNEWFDYYFELDDDSLAGDYSIILAANHYYVLRKKINIILNKVKCKRCMKWVKNTNHHKDLCRHCKSCHRKLNNNPDKKHVCPTSKPRPHKQLSVKKNKKLLSKFVALEDIYFADLETFPAENNNYMKVYSSAIVSIDSLKNYLNDKVNVNEVKCGEFYGKKGFDKFCKYMLSLKGTIVFYNGSRFDLFLVMDWLLKNKVEIKELLRDDKANKIISMEVEKIKFWDLCLFTNCSLARACKDLKVPSEYCKKDFNHKLVYDWESAERHRDIVVEYNAYDVISLGIAYLNFAESMWRLYSFNCNHALTLSNMAYEIWRNSYINDKELSHLILPTNDQYNFMRRALFGGRCCPQRKIFISNQMEAILEAGSNIEQRQRIFDTVDDYLIYLDVVSLYPYSSVVSEFPMGKCDFIEESDIAKFKEWFDNYHTVGVTKSIKDEIKKCFFEVDVVCPNNIITPFLFSRSKKGELLQDLAPKFSQVYDGGSLLEAVQLGYRIIKIRKCLRYQYLHNPLKGFMTHAFQQKANSAKDSVDYSIHKYLMNGLTGKFNQMLHEHDWKVHYEDIDLSKALKNNSITKVEWVINTDGVILGILAAHLADTRPNKPLAIGVNILAFSRILMSWYTRIIKGYWNENHASYYGDTDSMIIHRRAFDYVKKLNDQQVLGDDFGKLKEEYPGSKMIRAIFLAPKTYIMEFFTPQMKRWWKIAAKGIPQSENTIDVDKYYNELDVDVADRVRDLKDVVYSLLDKDNNIVSTRVCLNWDYFFRMTKGFKVVVSFGALKRRLVNPNAGNIPGTVELNLDQFRTINQNDWWASGKRSNYSEFEVSFPKGHLNFL